MSAISRLATAEEIASDLEIIQAKFVVAHEETLENVLNAAKIYGLSESNILVFGDTDVDNIRCVDNTLFGSEELGVPVEYTKEEIMNDPAYLYFTSGTTGRKKAVIITQYIVSSSFILSEWPFPKINILAYTEFNHGSALMATIHLPIYYGCTAFVMKNYTFRGFCEAIQTHHIVLTATQPYIISALAKDSIAQEYDISSLKVVVCTGAALDISVIRLAKEKLGMAVLNAYGLTEVMGMFINTPDTSLAGGNGYLGYGCEARLVDEEGNDVPEGEMGELWVKAPTLTRGYYKNPEATARAFDTDGYFHTGDLFKRSEDGNFTYIDRAKDLIKYLLHHIRPSEIEQVLITHPAVSDCVVIGVYSPELVTELPRAYVQLVGDAQVNENMEQELQEFADNQLSDVKRLRGGVVIVDSFPRTSSGKIQRRALKLTAQSETTVHP